MAATICLDFLMFRDNTPIPVPFKLAGFNFTMVAGGMKPFVNESGGGKGLQFPDQGMKIKLPAPASGVRLKLGQFATPINITLSGPGLTVVTAVTNWPNAYKTKTFNLKKGRAALVVLTGGNNEGIL